MGRRRSRAAASSVIADSAIIANRMPWQLSLILGLTLFSLCYWVIPAILVAQQGDGGSPIIRSVVAELIQRRIHWFEFLAIALALVFGFFALWSYLGGRPVSSDAERRAGLLSRLLARWIDESEVTS